MLTEFVAAVQGIVSDITFAWSNIHVRVLDREDQGHRFMWCLKELTCDDELLVRLIMVKDLHGFMKMLPWEIHYAAWQYASWEFEKVRWPGNKTFPTYLESLELIRR